MAVEVGEGFGVVGDHGVKVEGLRVGEVGVGDGHGDVRPIGAEPAAEAVGIVARAKVVVAGFRVALLALEFVIVLGAGIRIGALAAVGIEIGVVADDTSVVSDDAGSAERILDIKLRGAAGGEQSNAFAAEKDVFVGIVARTVGFGQDFAPGAVPVKFVGDLRCVSLGDAAAIAIVNVIRCGAAIGGGLEFAFAVPGLTVSTIVRDVAGLVWHEVESKPAPFDKPSTKGCGTQNRFTHCSVGHPPFFAFSRFPCWAA